MKLLVMHILRMVISNSKSRSWYLFRYQETLSGPQYCSITGSSVDPAALPNSHRAWEFSLACGLSTPMQTQAYVFD